MKTLRPALILASALLIGVSAAPAQNPPAPSAPAALVPGQPPPPPRVRASPHETISATIGGRGGPRITITYGRPYTKHPRSGEMRTIWGGLVPWDKAWRLGADEATLLITQAPLKFGDTTIPAGAYTLYLVPSESGVTKLAFSSALGKWGDPVDETNDIARVVMDKHAIETSVDQLTLGVEGDPSGAGGLLKIAWEKTVFSAAFSVVK
jgi:hypothetical protein